MGRFGPDNLSTLQIKGHVLHRARAHLKVPAWLLVWNALLTKKLPMFLSRLNEISGGCEKILPASGSFWSNLRQNSPCREVVIKYICIYVSATVLTCDQASLLFFAYLAAAKKK